jgi:hypothetical protein
VNFLLGVKRQEREADHPPPSSAEIKNFHLLGWLKQGSCSTSTICCRELKEPVLLVGFEVLTAVAMESSVFWNIRPCTPLKIDRHFGGTNRLHLNGRRMLLYAGIFLGYFSTLKTQKTHSSEKSIDFLQTTGRNIPEY